MKFFIYLLLFMQCTFSFFVFGVEDEVVFNLKRKKQKEEVQEKKRKPVPLKFRRQSFSYSEDFVVFNEKPKSDLKKGTFLRVNIPYSIIASFNEKFPVYGIVTHPFKGIISGTVKGIKNTNKAIILFDEVIISENKTSIESFPVFLSGDLKESLLKDISLNFFESLPSILALAFKTQIPQTGIHFITADLKNKVSSLSSLKTEKRTRKEYLELKNIKLFKVLIK